MKKPDAKLFNFISFIALALIAVLMLIGGLLRGSLLGNILETVSNALTLFVVGVSAYRFVPGKPTWVKIVYAVSIVVLVVGTVFIWIF
ncbi:MAG: hypothetical protein E7382_04120 [Clostridiales bacterium]|nr:hypothetical protein [Clostridiales bacterium]